MVFVLKGKTSAHQKRWYLLTYGNNNPGVPETSEHLIRLSDNVYHEEQDSFKIETRQATYYYHELGAGFASIEDSDGNDWLGYRPGGGPAGEYRGIPNMGYPEGYCHPGKTVSTSRILNKGPVKVSIYSESNDGKWSCSWDIFPSYARMTVLKTSHPYWFLYEGTPGGKLDLNSDYCVRPTVDGITQTPASEKWEGDIRSQDMEGEWLYFGDGVRALYLIHHEDDDAIDSYWPMEGEMTVFGFGRLKLEKFMTELPAHFTIGLCGSSDHETIKKVLDSAYRPLAVNVYAAD